MKRKRMLKAALRYARAGWPVFPLHSIGSDGCTCGDSECSNAGKHPRTAHGFKDATTDRATIRGWWKKWPNANIGIATGAQSGIIVLDIDSRHDGFTSFRRLERRYSRLPKSHRVRTGGGGQHHYLRSPGVPVRSKSGIATGIDVRGEGGYIVAPPSRHASGKRYEWLGIKPTDLGSLANIPNWLLGLMTKKVSEPSNKKVAHAILERERNTTLTSLAGAMRRRGASKSGILAALRKENRKRCKPPLGDNEVKRIATNVSKYPPADEEAGGKDSAATRLVALAESATFLHTPDQQVFAVIDIDGHKETRALKGQAFRRYLASKYYKTFGTVPSTKALQDALGVIEGRGLYESPEKDVFTRIAGGKDEIILDLGDRAWRSIRIDAEDWRVLSDSQAKFRRPAGMKPLPVPRPGGSIDELRRFLNLAHDDDFILLVSWLVAALRPTGPYPVLLLQGEAGSAKSTTANVLRALVDPNTSPLRSAPREVRDLMIAAQNAWCVAFDNVSYLPPWLSDALCRLATGGGFATRELYTDDSEKIFEATRPVLLNGIEGVATRGDLLDRCLMLYLPPIPPDRRMAEKKFWRLFRKRCPFLLGTLLDAVSCALKRLPTIFLDQYPRMADFAEWATAAEASFGWPDGTFMRAYNANQVSANVVALESSLLVAPIKELNMSRLWRGTARELLQLLSKRHTSSGETLPRDWPKNPQVLAVQLRRVAPNLRAIGINVQIGEKTAGSRSKRIITIQRVKPNAIFKPVLNRPVPGPDGKYRFPRTKRDASDASDAKNHKTAKDDGVEGVGRVEVPARKK
jgi:Bifunctional DNA primase/polymerase, N-terminal/Primase C terminal 1 (PriCT-1)